MVTRGRRVPSSTQSIRKIFGALQVPSRLLGVLDQILIERAISVHPKSPVRQGLLIKLWAIRALPSIREFLARRSIALLRQEWLTGHISHTEATHQIEKVIDHIHFDLDQARSAFALRRLLGSAGLFSAGAALAPRQLSSSNQMSVLNLSRFDQAWLTRFAIATENKELAADTLRALRRSATATPTQIYSRYLTFWLEGSTSASGPAIILGPAECEEEKIQGTFTSAPINQVLIPTGTSGRSLAESLHPEVASVYSNGMTNEWLASLRHEEREAVLDRAQVVRVKRLEDWMRHDSRFESTPPCKHLYLSGNPNMVPFMVVDLILRGYAPLYVTGATFFLGSHPYRATQRRLVSLASAATDEFGSSGQAFERCRGISGHDQLINIAIIRNLFREGLVTGDRSFRTALEMSTKEYLQCLDETYGIRRR